MKILRARQRGPIIDVTIQLDELLPAQGINVLELEWRDTQPLATILLESLRLAQDELRRQRTLPGVGVETILAFEGDSVPFGSV